MYATIKDVEPVPQGAGQWVRTRNDLERLVETPLLAACGQLYDKNVPTNASTANANNVALGQANISIDYDALSSENREIADKNFRVISHDDGIRSVQIDIPIEGPDVSVDVLSRRASAAAEKFRYQPMDWAPRYTFDELVEECFSSAVQHARRGQRRRGGAQAVAFQPLPGISEFRHSGFHAGASLCAEGAFPASSHAGLGVFAGRHDMGVFQSLLLAGPSERGSPCDQLFPEDVGATDGGGPAHFRGGLAKEEELAWIGRGLGHFVVQINVHFRGSLVGGENLRSVIYANCIGERFVVGEARQVESRDEGIEVLWCD